MKKETVHESPFKFGIPDGFFISSADFFFFFHVSILKARRTKKFLCSGVHVLRFSRDYMCTDPIVLSAAAARTIRAPVCKRRNIISRKVFNLNPLIRAASFGPGDF